MHFTWKIESVDDIAGTMVVTYVNEDGISNSYNMARPLADQDVKEWIERHAPVTNWIRAKQQGGFAPLVIGDTGDGTVAPQAVSAPPETPKVLGDWGEEYLRALIYQVLEEIKENEI